ncbi:hypothetical protein [Actinoplanes aureus]|uniref:Uncharacterized protein n=1 Tax=Actinoplanes aureus TaxID=2792083 RepID=A0A931G3J7_9ACTN|nr:hypothetical protein [Actinoplanes aureus]MBG0569340.1 hypothetical protein [Actinoplanes aureus]
MSAAGANSVASCGISPPAAPAPQVLTRHGRLAAALIHPAALLGRPEPDDRLDADTLLRDGYRIELICEPGGASAAALVTSTRSRSMPRRV